MRIGIDANCLLFEKAGFGKYTRQLVKNMLQLDQKNEYFLYFNFLRHRRERNEVIGDFLSEVGNNQVNIRVSSLPAQWKEALTMSALPINYLIKDPLDLYYSPSFSGVPRKGFEKMVVTLHDLVFMRFPFHRGIKLSNYYLRRTKIAVANCKKIIVPSRATGQDLQTLLGVPIKKIKIIPEGVSEDFSPALDKTKTRRIIQKYFYPETKYILSVGTLEPRKNLSLIVKAYSNLPNQLKRDYKIVFVGGKGWNNAELGEAVISYNLSDKVIFTGFVSDEDLPYIYSGASVFVFPSLYEGFGLPPLEAMASGCPVICSNSSSLPEVVGRAALLVDPKKEESLTLALKKVLTSSRLARSMKNRGIIQAKKFSWQRAAQETIKLFEEVANASKSKSRRIKKKDR